jgi:hypothetical protein
VSSAKYLIALMGTVAFASPAFGQPGEVTVTGAVADRCLFTTRLEAINITELAQTGSGANAGRLDASTVNGATRKLAGWCNGSAATMTVEAQPLLNTSATTAPPTGFDRRVDYTATAVANAASATDTSVGTAGAGTAVSVGLFTGDVEVTLSAASTPTSGLLVAGRYQGAVLVTLTPNVSFTAPATPSAQ